MEKRYFSVISHELNNFIQILNGYAELYKIKKIRSSSFSSSRDLDLLVNLITSKILVSIRKIDEVRNGVDQRPFKEYFFKIEEYLNRTREFSRRAYTLAYKIKLGTEYKWLDDDAELVVETALIQLEKIIFLTDYYFKDTDLGFESINLSLFLTELQESYQNVYIRADRNDEKKVSGNRYALQMILGNLIQNAQKHAGSENIQILAYTSDKNWVIEVVNDIHKKGGHIAPYWLEKIVYSAENHEVKKGQRLFVLPFSTSEEDGHPHGIGLKLIWGLVSAMGGTIHVTSQEDETRFRIVLPFEGTKMSMTGTGSMRLPIFRAEVVLEEAL